MKIPSETDRVLANEMSVHKETETSIIMMRKLSEDHSHNSIVNLKTAECPSTGVIRKCCQFLLCTCLDIVNSIIKCFFTRRY